MVRRLENKVIFISGGNSGIGLACAQEFVSEGAEVIILARSAEKADEALAQINGKASAVLGDVADLASLKRAFDEVADRYGQLDGLVISAGIAIPGALGDVDAETYDSMFNVNVKGAFFSVQYAQSLLQRGSSVILVSSCLHEMGMAGMSVYSASKAALRSLARSLTPDLEAIGGRINVISPGPIRTEVLKKSGMTEEQVDAQFEVFNQNIAAGRVGLPEEIAKTALFLASDDSSFLYGADIQADGGLNQTRWPRG